MKKLFSLFFALLGFAAQAQVTFKITAVPANTPANATLYMAGTFNGWNPGSAAHALTYNAADRSYQLTLPAGTGTLEYKQDLRTGSTFKPQRGGISVVIG